MNKPIYEPKTRAKEYCDLAINIYQGCSHGCTYCYACKMFNQYNPGKDFSMPVLREGILEATARQLQTGNLKSGYYSGKTIQLCFMCDPYPAEIDTTPTREIIKLIKAAGAHVQILTKGGDRARRDFDLLDSGDSFGITLTCLSGISKREEPGAALPNERANTLLDAARLGIKTWISFEPVLSTLEVLQMIDAIPALLEENRPLLKIGKLNHVANSIDWKAFGLEAERICKANGWNYYIKEDLRKCMTS
jgi:DNA repair photolyase